MEVNRPVRVSLAAVVVLLFLHHLLVGVLRVLLGVERRHRLLRALAVRPHPVHVGGPARPGAVHLGAVRVGPLLNRGQRGPEKGAF